LYVLPRACKAMIVVQVGFSSDTILGEVSV
jgi:hypothetical protein